MEIPLTFVKQKKNKGRGKRTIKSHKTHDTKKRSAPCCWICQLEENCDKPHLTKVIECFCFQERFQPCLCKGSLQNVHKECLNRWAHQKYCSVRKNMRNGSLLGQDSDSLPDIECPNCKYLYNYTVKETSVYKFRKLKDIRLLSMEILPLLVLLIFQVVLLALDFSLSNAMKINRHEESESSMAKASNVIHIITVLILIVAACYNIMQSSVTDIKIEVHDKDAQISD